MFILTRWLCVPLAAAACALAAGNAAAQTPVTGPAGAITPPPDVLERQSPTPVLGPGERIVDDMIFDASQLTPLDWQGQTGAHYESFTARPWEFGVVPIAFDGDVTVVDRDRFWAACALWANAGVVCVERSNQPVWVGVSKIADGCYARVGMGTSGSQVINLESPGCWSQGTVAHEIGHAVGLIHEHQRPDRDTYVTINYSNIEAGKSSNFTTYVTARMWTPYDFGSLMHYGKYAFAKDTAIQTITPKPDFVAQAQNMGQRTRPSDPDQTTMAGLYNLPPRVFRSYPLTPRQLTIGRVEALAAMATLNSYYLAPQGMARSNGLSIGGKPDFLGLAAWFFDVYVNSRFAGYQEIEARFNVMASLTQSQEWRVKHPGQSPATPFAIGNALPFDRTELLAVLERLDRFYVAPEGLQRPNGLSLDGQPDFLGIAAWVTDIYMGQRLAGVSPDASWQRVVVEIQRTDEWKTKHR